MTRKLPMGVEIKVPIDLETYAPYRIHRLSSLTSNRDAKTGAGTTLKIREWRIILTLAFYGPLTISEISQRLFSDNASTTRGVQKLVETGFAMSRSHLSDKRKLVVTLTDAGAAAHDEIARQRMALSSEILSPLSEKERKQFFHFISLIEANLSQGNAEEEDPFSRAATHSV